MTTKRLTIGIIVCLALLTAVHQWLKQDILAVKQVRTFSVTSAGEFK